MLKPDIQETLCPKGMWPVRDVQRSARHTDTAAGEKELPKSFTTDACGNAGACVDKSVELDNPVEPHKDVETEPQG